jgi:[ribosomal protein S5]-alanine N-acetyltransferase
LTTLHTMPEFPSDQPDLESERLLLRKLRLDDAADMFEWASDPEVTRYLSWEPKKTVEECRLYIESVIEAYNRHEFGGWGVELKTEKKLVGALRMHHIDTVNRRTEWGAVMNPRFQNRGIMTEAYDILFNFIFTRLPINRIEGYPMDENAASEKVLIKLGMTHEGNVKQYYYFKQAYHDCKIYRILREEYFAMKKK